MRWSFMVLAGCGSFSGPGLTQVTDDGSVIAPLDTTTTTTPDSSTPVPDAALVVDSTVFQPDANLMVDTDGDGVPDVMDNCPTMKNPGQENEDADKFGDVCDPCPPVHDDNPPDADGDGVADACDPRPNTKGDVIQVFEGFAHGAPSTWVGQGTVSGTGTLTATGSTSLGPAFAPNGGETVSASVALASGSYAGIGLAADQNNYILCELYSQFGIPNNTTGSIIYDGQNTGKTAFAFSADTPFVVTLTRNNSLFTCSANGGTGNSLTRQFVPVFAGIETANATGHFQWFMVVSHP